jgi:hypothetical protein
MKRRARKFCFGLKHAPPWMTEMVALTMGRDQ